MFKYTLVPASFFTEADADRILSEAVQLSEQDKVIYKELPQFKAVLVYVSTDAAAPVIAELLDGAKGIVEHNKIIAATADGSLHLVIVTGDKLLLANSYPAPDHVTAEYFIFAAMKRFQINPQVSTVYVKGGAEPEMLDDIVRYCKGVESL